MHDDTIPETPISANADQNLTGTKAESKENKAER